MTDRGRTPAASVVMPVYNEAAFVEAAVDSVLQQTVTDLELVIVDNGSSDATPEILRRISDPRVRVFRNPHNLGSAAASNRAVRESRGALIARMDADDVALPNRIELQLAAFASQPKLALIGAQVCHTDVRGRPLLQMAAPKALTPVGIGWQSLFNSPFVHSTAMFTRESFESTGGYDERMQRSSDFALFSRIQRNFHVANLPDIVVRHRSMPRPLLLDSTYDSLVRAVIDDNARHFLQPQSADSAVAEMIAAWPDFALMLRGAARPNLAFGRAALPEFLSAFRARFGALHRDPAGDLEIARDATFVLCLATRDALRSRRPDAVRLARGCFVHAPVFASAFFVRLLADVALTRAFSKV